MPATEPGPAPGVHEHTEHHRDGSMRARGQTADGVLEGYWEWFRLDGTRLRSGHFAPGEQVGEWITYDAAGRVYKVTTKKPRVDGAGAGAARGSRLTGCSGPRGA